MAETDGPQTALAALDGIEAARVKTYQPWWATRAHVLARIGDTEAALEAFDPANGLSDDPAARTYLATRKARLLQA